MSESKLSNAEVQGVGMSEGKLLWYKNHVTLLEHAIECLQETMTGKTSKLQAAVANISLVKDDLLRAQTKGK